jgi:hypothetical protein
MDERVKYKIASQKDAKRAALLSRLDDCASQQRECGILALGIERALGKEDWCMVERLALALNRIRESQQKARERAGELVDMAKFKVQVLDPLITIITQRIQQHCPDDCEDIVDAIADDWDRLQSSVRPKLLEGPKP